MRHPLACLALFTLLLGVTGCVGSEPVEDEDAVLPARETTAEPAVTPQAVDDQSSVLAASDLGPTNRQKKNVANIKWTPGKP